jgi:hypothetical protein
MDERSHRNLPLPDGDNDHEPDAHSLQSALCRRCEEVSSGQINVAVATAATGLVASFIFDLALIAVWYHHAMLGNAMPSVPWFIISIATATHAAGGLSALKIPRKQKVQDA